MTDNIINIDDKKPSIISMVVCLKCFERWVAIRPEQTRLKDLECSECGQGYVIETGERIFNDEDK